jgi:hypothetical protein
MTKEQMLKAAECDFNKLFKCTHKHLKSHRCHGPCNIMEIEGSLQMCPLCSNPIEQGYCLNKLCVNHG